MKFGVSDGLESTFSGFEKEEEEAYAWCHCRWKPVPWIMSGDAGEDFDDHIGEDEEGEGIVLHTRYPWEGTDRDYEYEERAGCKELCIRFVFVAGNGSATGLWMILDVIGAIGTVIS
uniref:Uncharacterized protein n=1 Tax=Fagus sylvatica TaxID=28930 RepID=A0A2N9EX87_FAGSY